MKWLTALAVMMLCASAHAQVYKCSIGGATVFQDRPCAGSGEKVNVKPASGTEAKSTASIDALRLNVKVMELERRVKEVDDRIALGEREINQLQVQRDRDIQVLQAKKSLARNNLAGATYEQSISTEMQAVSDTYRTRIQVVRDRIDGHRKDLADLRKQQSEFQ
jgi:hypothetical protein